MIKVYNSYELIPEAFLTDLRLKYMDFPNVELVSYFSNNIKDELMNELDAELENLLKFY